VVAPVVPSWLLVVLAIGAVGLAVLAARRLQGPSRRERWTLGTLRALALLLVVACLLRPAIIVSRAVDQRNVLAILLDDSRSMRIADADDARRIDAVAATFGDSTALVRQLGERFALRFFRFSGATSPLAAASALTATGTRTDLAAALDGVRQELADVPLAGVVVVTDGADNSAADLEPPLLGFRARRVPLYTVGVGAERFARDIAVERVALPASVLDGGAAVADVTLGMRGADGETVKLSVEANGRVVHQEDVTLQGGRETMQVPLRIPPLPEGTHLILVRATPLAREVILENNEAHGVLRVRPGREKVLYLEGEPRPEFGFLRRAVADDSALQLVAVLRSAPGKYLRLGVDDSLELATGFPTRRADLFRYRAIVLGNIEAPYFSGDQLRMLGEFVSRRGGSLLMLGGRATLAEGGFSGTPVDEVLPMALQGSREASAGEAFAELAVRPTVAGRVEPMLQLAATASASAARWGTLPPLTSVNRLGAVRPGATVLLEGQPSGGGTARPLFATQRYGRGKSAIFGVQDSWLWRMDPTAPLEDATHAAFWRQMLRWLLDDVPERVDLATTPAQVGPGETVTMRVRVADADFLDLDDANTVVQVTPPVGEPFDVTLDRLPRESGSYIGQFTPTLAGRYELAARAQRFTDTAFATPVTMLADTLGMDMERAELRTPLLRRIAEATGGNYYPIAEANKLIDDVQLTESGITVRDARDLWDAPIVFFVILALLGAEWGLRRRWGLS
jgi:uncharacterized membrane protein